MFHTDYLSADKFGEPFAEEQYRIIFSEVKMSWKIVFNFILMVAVLSMKCGGIPLPEVEVQSKEVPSQLLQSSISKGKEIAETEARAGQENQAGGISSAVNNFQNGLSALYNASNMKDAKMILGGFSILIMPAPNLQQLGQLGQLNPGMIPQLPAQIPSLPGKK